MGTHGSPDIYNLIPLACSPQALGEYTRQTTVAHVTTIQYILLIIPTEYIVI